MESNYSDKNNHELDSLVRYIFSKSANVDKWMMAVALTHFLSNFSNLNTMKTQENLWLSVFFSKYKMGTSVKNELRN